MRILISGSTGMLGTSLIESLQTGNDTPVRLMRKQSVVTGEWPSVTETLRWDPAAGHFESDAAEGADALVHLAGASIADKRWSAARKELLLSSRVDATRHLIGSLAHLKSPPRVVVAASAIGYYGDRGDESLTESNPPGSDFLSRLCIDWEAESGRAAEFGARVVMLRIGIILTTRGGALPRMALPFKLGVGGRLGSSRRWISWLTLEETIGIIRFAISNPALAGPVNTVSPNPARNSEFTRALARELRRPALFPVPAFGLRLLLGEMAEAVVSSQRVLPSKLEQAGYRFLQPDLRGALHEIFRKRN